MPAFAQSRKMQDLDDMVLLREKLNQIAVGRQTADNQLEHMEHSDGEDDHDAHRRRQYGHFRVFLSNGDRPSTPPSSPQPRDVLRKQLRMKNHTMFIQRRSLSMEDNNSDTASDEPLDSMCVDTVEISPVGDDDDHAFAQHPTVQLSIPENIATTSSFSVLNKCPEGFRKRKSFHIEDKNASAHETTPVPLKKVSSQVNILSSTADARRRSLPDADMDDSDSDAVAT
ncbi:hypothetical protein Poli38472_003042 [Pythium oligandrum]|uniref:Uncharacterized protein n=1 Tax=Pythium oligandrum TaxID=41045 RepID=A0A8K1C6U9_PYTOL|nr:hypothetical protein Poli38472_003042 [Pythium oligandrum]|eukprot:TMW57117.1 hypothetical protein Poli38472_003042 [Pythium oligandrum]